MDIFTWGVVFFATGISLTVFIFGVPLSIKAPKNQPTLILMAGMVLSTCAFLAGITELLLETSHSDFGTKATVFTSVFTTLAPVLFVCFILQALFLRSTRQSILNLKALLIVLFFIGQLGLGVFLFKHNESINAHHVTLAFVQSTFRSVNFLLFMGWIYWEARTKVKEHPNFPLNFIQIFCGLCLVQALAWTCFLAADFSNDFELVDQLGGWLALDMINRIIRTGVFCLVQVLICLYWSQHYSLSAIQERQKQERIQDLLKEKDALIRNLSTSTALIESGALSAGLAHEFNQFLTRIEMNTDEALHLVDGSNTKIDDLKRPLGNIRKANRAAATLVVNLKKLFQTDAEHSDFCNVDDLVRDVVSLYTNRLSQSNIQIELRLQVSQQLSIWEHLFRQVVVNLLSNAIEALNASSQANKLIRIESSIAGEGQYCLVLTDNGPGIRSEQEAKMFNMFATSKSTGTGIGLWLSRYIVERHQGSLQYENLPNQAGVSFVISIPVGNTPR
jgi:signal transduction histidine kinase